MVADIEGYLYKTVLIGSQVWMAENLRTKKYNDNSDITLVTDATAWIGLSTEAYCWYNNNEATNKPLYGALYNWFAVNTEELCPTGWHVPTDGEFMILERQLGMTEAQTLLTSWRGTDQGTQMKNNAGWTTGNGTNSSGFAGLPGGYRYYELGSFQHAGDIGYWWTSTVSTSERSFARQLESSRETVERTPADNNAGKSVRCLKD